MNHVFLETLRFPNESRGSSFLSGNTSCGTMWVMSNDVAEKILSELKALRREVAFLVPTESLDDYENMEDIVAAYDEARKEFKLD